MNKNIAALAETTVLWMSKKDFEEQGVAWFEKLGFTLSPVTDEVTEMRSDGYHHYTLSESLRFFMFPEGGFIETGYLKGVEERGYEPLRGEKYYGFAHFHNLIGEAGWAKTAFRATDIHKEYFRLARKHVYMYEAPLYYQTPRYAADGTKSWPKDGGAVMIPMQIEPSLFSFVMEHIPESDPSPDYAAGMAKLMQHENGATQISNVLLHCDDFDEYATRMEMRYEFAFEKSETKWVARFPETGQRLTIVNDEGLEDELGKGIEIKNSPRIVAPYAKVPSITALKAFLTERDVPFEEKNGRVITRQPDNFKPGVMFVFEEAQT